VGEIIAIIILACAIVALLAWGFFIVGANGDASDAMIEELLRERRAHGDVPNLPDELRAATRKTWGSEAASSSGPVGDIARRHGRSV
jgi:hypothetical protein